MITKRKLLLTSASFVAAPLVLGAGTAQLKLGQSAAFTGAQAGFGLAMRAGISAAIAQAGAAAKNIELIALDDAGDPKKTEANLKDLFGRGVTAFVGATTRPCSELAAQFAAANDLALVGAFSGTPLLYGPKAPTTFATRASYQHEMESIVRHYSTLGAKRFGLVHLEDAKATNVPLLEEISARAGAKLTIAVGIDRAGTAMNAAAIATLQANRPDVVIMLANNKPLTPLLRDYAPATIGLPKVIISFVDRTQLIADLGAAGAGVAFSNVVPEVTAEKHRAVLAFRAAMAGGGAALSQVALEGFVTGLAAIEGLKRARQDTRSGFLDGMFGTTELDLGYTRFSFSKQNRAGSRYVDLALATGKGLIS